ncbi:MAG TPA: helix-turn-helix domain-containing protein [Xanthobacteraceae bacterium]|nr:helix-turn-helix domain-containing protein [Xanthobacteraceae bacterium]
MAATNRLFIAPPHPVEKALKDLGTNLRTARLRRKMTIEDVATRIGTGPRAVMEAEKGKPSTGAAVYLALLWAYGLLAPVEELADPTTDTEGLARDSASGRVRARKSAALDNDF